MSLYIQFFLAYVVSLAKNELLSGHSLDIDSGHSLIFILLRHMLKKSYEDMINFLQILQCDITQGENPSEKSIKMFPFTWLFA